MSDLSGFSSFNIRKEGPLESPLHPCSSVKSVVSPVFDDDGNRVEYGDYTWTEK